MRQAQHRHSCSQKENRKEGRGDRSQASPNQARWIPWILRLKSSPLWLNATPFQTLWDSSPASAALPSGGGVSLRLSALLNPRWWSDNLQIAIRVFLPFPWRAVETCNQRTLSSGFTEPKKSDHLLSFCLAFSLSLYIYIYLFIYWSIADLQCFRCTARWFSYTYAHILF